MSLSREQFIQRLEESSLMSTADVETLVESLPPQDQPQDGEQLARLLVKQQKLTAFQAKQIYSGNEKSLVLGNYIVLDKLGQGGMGMVLKAEHRRMHRLVALKVLSPAATKTPAATKRFLREVEAAAKLEHPNIVTAYDADESGGTHFLVMQYVEGKDLSVLVKKKGSMAVDKAVNCILQAARGLQYAHEQGVIHRDIKPANLLVDAKGTVQILDMGLARLENTGGNPDQAELTSTGQIMGTVDYMAPEQALSTKDADARSDIYSLGITLWYLLTARAAYDGDNLTAKLLAHQQSPIPSLEAACSGASAQLDTVFQKMVAKQPADRQQTMSDVVTDLERCLSPTAAAPTITATSSEDSKFQAFLSNLGSDSPPTIASSDKTNASAEIDYTPTVSYDSSTEETNLQVDAELNAVTNSAAKAVKTSGLPINLRDRRVQIGGAAAALLIVAGLIWGLTGDRSPDKPTETTTNGIPSIAVAPFDKNQATEYQQAWARYLKLPKQKNVELPGGATMAFMLIPPGEFTMGSTDDGSQSEDPSRRVKISDPFYLAKYELTQAEWLAVMGDNPSHFKGDLALPVETVRWEDSQALLNQLNTDIAQDALKFILPTEAQWEYACRAGTTERWHFGDNEALLGEYGVFKNNSVGGTHAVGGRKPNPWGLYDMYGNVWEWCADWYAEFESEPNLLRDPVGPESGERRVNRGGSYSAHAYSCRSAYRAHNPPTAAYGGIGFRLALAIKSTKTEDDTSPKVPKSKSLEPPPLAAAPFDSNKARRHQQAWANFLEVDVEKKAVIPGGGNLTLVLIPPGEFLMGSTDKERKEFASFLETIDRKISPLYVEREGPQHKVRIDRPFWLSKHEITREQFRQFEQATQFQERHPSGGDEHGYGFVNGEFVQRPEFGWDADLGYPQSDKHPVVNVSWMGAAAFCHWLTEKSDDSTYSLPTEAQWEYACRAGTDTYWNSGDTPEELKKYAWMASNSAMKSHPVGQSLPNSFGLHDMLGNVWEYCNDFFSNHYYNSSPQLNPTGPESGRGHVHRGGAWHAEAMECRSAVRIGHSSNDRHHRVGFRVAMTVNSPKLPQLKQPDTISHINNTALAFNGKTSHVDLPTLRYDASHPLTIEAWVESTGNNLNPRIINNDGRTAAGPNGGLIVQLSKTGQVGFLLQGEKNVRGETELPPGRHHLALVCDQAEARFYLDGKKVISRPGKYADIKHSLASFRIGTHSNGLSEVHRFKGTIDEVRFSNTARYTADFTPQQRFETDEKTLALYHCDEGRGEVLNDSSLHNHHGKVVDAIWTTQDGKPVASPSQLALQFDGAGYVNIPSLKIASPPQLTIEAIVKADTPHQGMIVSNAGRAGFGFKISNDRWKFDGYGMAAKFGIVADQQATYDQWTHVAAVIDGNRVKLFVDGQLQQETTTIDQLKPSASQVAIGANPEANGIRSPFRGAIRFVRISETARYKTSFKMPASFDKDDDTLAMYRFDEGQGSKLHDASGNNHHGHIVNAQWILQAEDAPIDHDRIVARGVLQAGGYVTLQLDEATGTTQVKQLDAIPAEKFTLRSIYLSNVKDIGNDQLFHLSKLRGLHELHLHNTNVTDVGLQYLPSITTLRNINLYGTKISDAGLQHLAALPKLHSVSLSSTPAESTGLAGLRNLKTLRSVLVSDQISKARVIELSAIPQLRELRIAGDPPQITSAVVAEFHKQNPHCRIRKLTGPVIGRDPVRELAEWVQQQGGRLTLGDLKSVSGYQDFTANQKLPDEAFRIRMIDLNRSENIVDADLARFTASTFLHELKLGNTKIGDDGVAHLANCTTLASIWLDQTQITNRSLETLSRLPNLAHYYLHTTQISANGLQALLRNPLIQGLSLGGKHITGEALGPISQMTDLKSLSLWSSDIGDADIQQLSKLHKLEKLDVSGTRVTRTAAEQLSKALPHCKISYGPGDDKIIIEPTAAADHDRAATLHVLRSGGTVFINALDKSFTNQEVNREADLPDVPFALRRVSFTGVEGISNDHLRPLSGLKELESISLQGTAVTDDGLSHLSSITDLNYINLGYTRLTEAGLQHLTALPSLTQLGMANSPLESSGTAGLAEVPVLRQLAISGNVSKERYLELTQIEGLREIVLTGNPVAIDSAAVEECHKVNPHCRTRILTGDVVGPDPVRELARWVQQQQGKLSLLLLKTGGAPRYVVANQPLPAEPFTIAAIHLNENKQLTDADLQRLTVPALLFEVQLDGTDIGDTGLTHLLDCPMLATIKLNKTRVTDKSLAQLHRLALLSSLEIAGTAVTDEGVKHLVPLRNLKRLAIGSDQITGDALTHLARMQHLQTLRLSKTNIGDDDILKLAPLKNLSDLSLSNSKVTPAGADRLKERLPACKITFGTID